MKKALKIILPLLLGVFLIWWSVKDMSKADKESVISSIKNADYFWLGLSVFIGILSHISRAWRWKYSLEAIGANFTLKNATFSVFISYLVNLAIPRAGEVSRVAVFSKAENNPFDKTLGTVVAERVVDMVLLLVTLGIVFLVQFDIIIQTIQPKEESSESSPVLLGVIAVVGLIVAIVGWRIISKAKEGILLKIKEFLLGIWEGLLSIWKMENKGYFLLHTFIIWGLYIAMFWVSIYAIPETSNIGFGAIITAFAAGGIAMVVSTGGLGAYPIAIATVLLNYGVPETAGTALGWAMWGAQTLMFLVLGGLSFFLITVMNREKILDEEHEG
ncbi:MAG: flippase-like domain-containing protein [Flavobacteriales bacterium]|nr:flippase-like domain-containing protein [Flavobacteriales bacterium]